MDALPGDLASGRPDWRPSRVLPVGEERLARLVGEGSERAFVVLYRRYHQPLYRYCRSLLRHEADAQDALQSTFAAAYAALRQGRRDAPIRPWLYRIAHNESISLLRRRRTHLELNEDAAGIARSPEEQAVQRERLATLVADLGGLPERQRAALVMRELSGLSHEQIAQALETSVGAVKQGIFEARRSLQEFAEGRAMACEDVCRLISEDRRAMRGRRVRAHVRSCPDCAAFARAIGGRESDLRALAPPLAAPAAGAVLAGVLGHGGGHQLGAGTAAGLAGKSAGLTLAGKAAIGAALVAGAAVGASRVLPHDGRAAHVPRAVHTAPARGAVHGGAPGAAATHATPALRRSGAPRHAAANSAASALSAGSPPLTGSGAAGRPRHAHEAPTRAHGGRGLEHARGHGRGKAAPHTEHRRSPPPQSGRERAHGGSQEARRTARAPKAAPGQTQAQPPAGEAKPEPEPPAGAEHSSPQRP